MPREGFARKRLILVGRDSVEPGIRASVELGASRGGAASPARQSLAPTILSAVLRVQR